MHRSHGISTLLVALALTSCTGSTSTTRTSTTRRVGPDGAELSVGAFTLTVPTGALAEPVDLRLTVLPDGPPSGYHAYSSLLRLEPDGLQLAAPATLAIHLDGAPAAPAVFLSSLDGPAYEWLGGVVDGDTIAAPVRHFSTAFAGQGDSYVDPADTSCTVTRLLEGRTLDPSAVALFVTVDDCHGAPITDLDADAFALDEDGSPLTSESVVTVLPRQGVHVFVTLLLDMSSSVAGHLDELIAGAKAFVNEVQASSDVPVRIAIRLFSGPERSTSWEPFWLVPEDVLAALDGLPDYTSPDPASTNLNGGVIDALDQSETAQAVFRAHNRGGAFTSGYVVVFTDGVDTAAWASEAEVLAALADSTDTVVAVGLETSDFDPAALARVAPGGTFTAGDGGGLTTAFGALANRIRGQIARSYLIGYCSPKKAGEHEVAVRIADSETLDAAAYPFDANGFGPGCSAEVFASACEGRECGGLGCGACDDRTSACDVSNRCLSFCTTDCVDPALNPNPFGYAQTCDAECDRDGIPAPEDTCPFVTSLDQSDYDDDGAGDLCDDDDDDDGVLDELDGCPRGASGWLSSADNDYDGDGCLDASEDVDIDGDGVIDELDACPMGETGWESSEALNDYDEDGCRDVSEDADDDDDGVADAQDGCPLSALGWTSTEASDHDGDGCDDGSADADDDDDGVVDVDDACPRGETGWTSGPESDPDGDGCAATEDTDDDDDGLEDAVDACPAGAAQWLSDPITDHDGDGCRDEDEDTDDDGDGVADDSDGCPRGVTGWTSGADTDIDGDGCRDLDEENGDVDNDGVADPADACPLGMSAGADYDGDGCKDAEDADDDGDGVADTEDACPRGASGWTSDVDNDVDGDGCRDADEDDDDGDGILDIHDACPQGLSAGADYDGDGCKDAEDEDDDGDGVPDAADACPRGATGWTSDVDNDVDGDGCRDADEDDDDGDGIVNPLDACPNGAAAGADYDGDGCKDAEDEDDDDDGVTDTEDACPQGPLGWVSTVWSDPDGDGCGDLGDVDGDGLPDTYDLCPDGPAACTCEPEVGWCAAEVRYLSAPIDSSKTFSPNWSAAYALSRSGAVCIVTRVPSRVVYRWDAAGAFAFASPVGYDVITPASPMKVHALDSGACLLTTGDVLARVDAQGVSWSTSMASSASMNVLADDPNTGDLAWAGTAGDLATAMVLGPDGAVLVSAAYDGPGWTAAAFDISGDLVLASPVGVARIPVDGSTRWVRGFTSPCDAPSDVYAGPNNSVIVSNRRLHGVIPPPGDDPVLTCAEPSACTLTWSHAVRLDPSCDLLAPTHGGQFQLCGDDPASEGVAVPLQNGLFTGVYHRGVVPHPGGFTLLVALDREGVETVPAVIRYAPCEDPCDDGDLCTDDGGTVTACSTTPNDGPMCAAP